MKITIWRKINKSTDIFKLLLFIIIISYCRSIQCDDRENPFLKNNQCSSTCYEGEDCIVNNEIIKTQWLNNIIYLDGDRFCYTNVATSEKNNLFLLSSGYPASKIRHLYILNHQGYGYLDNNNPMLIMQTNENDALGRFESEIFTFKLLNSNDDKEYLISVSKSEQYLEVYDIDNNNIYYDTVATVFGSLKNVFTVVGVHLKLKSAEAQNKNIYLIGLLACEYANSIEYGYFYLKKVSFTSINIKDNKPSYSTQKTESSQSKIVSCYETNNYYIVCFFQNKLFEYTVIVYDSNLEEKKQAKISLGYYGEGYQEWFFKCVHFFNETGAFAYFTSATPSVLNFEFKRYFDNNNTIVNHFSSISKYTIRNYDFDKLKVTLCDMIKVEDRKFYFVGTNDDRKKLVIISIFNYNQNYIARRIYTLNIKNLYNYQISECLRLTIYNQFLSIGLSYMNASAEWHSYPSLLIFGYVKSNDTELDLINYMYFHNDTKIYNLTLELQGKYIIENNIFGYIYSGVEIIENCEEVEEGIYLADLNDEKIISDYFVPKNEKIKLIIPKKDTYTPFMCNFQYASVVSEPEYSEYNKYPVEFVDSGTTIQEDYFYENNKKNYIGRYSNYKLIINSELTVDCKENCELCYTDIPNSCIVCKYSSFFDNDVKICQNKPPETEMADTEGATEKTETEGVTEKTETEGITEITKTDGVTEKTETEGVTEITKTEGVTEKTETEGVTEKPKSEGVTEKTEIESATEITKTEGVTEKTETEGVTEKAETENLTEKTENEETTDKSSGDNFNKVQTDMPKDTDILNATNKISEKYDTDEASLTNNHNENGNNTDETGILTNKISEIYNNDETTEINNQSEKDTDISSITNKISEKYDTDEVSTITNHNDKSVQTNETEKTYSDKMTEINTLSEISETDIKETDKVTNNDISIETDKLSEKDLSKNSDEFTYKEITNKIIDEAEVCTFDQIIENKCKGEITNNQVVQMYSHIKSNLINSTNSTLIKTDNIIFQITPTDVQKELNDPTVSNIDLGKCEILLKQKYNISKEQSLIMFKIDIKNVEEYSTYVQYEIYHPKTFIQLNLDVCEKENIKIYPPVYLDNKTISLYSDLDKSGYNLFNSSDSFYNDICTPYTTENGTDIILVDRQKDIYNNNGKKALCQNGCQLVLYNQTTNKATCNCPVQNNDINLDISDLQTGKAVLEKSFLNTLSNSNFRILICYKLAFDFSTIFENIGRIIMTFLLFFVVILFVLYCIFGVKKLYNYLKDILKQKVINNNNDKNNKDDKNKSNNKLKEIKQEKQDSKTKKRVSFFVTNKKRASLFNKRMSKNIIKRKSMVNNPLLEKEKKIVLSDHNNSKKEKNRINVYKLNNNKNKDNSREKFNTYKKQSSKLNITSKHERKNNKNKTHNVGKMNKPGPPKKGFSIIQNNKNNPLESIEKAGTNQNIIISKNVIINMNKKKGNTINIKNQRKSFMFGRNNKNEILKKSLSIDKIVEKMAKKYTSQELNSMEYKDALKNDKRTYLQYYWSLIKKKQLILFTLVNDDDYNLIIIKSALFLLSFSLYITINGFFFTDETMHVIYKTNGIYNIISQIPKIFYSTLVTAVVNMILKNLSLSEASMLEIKKEKKYHKAQKKSKEVWNCIKIKVVVFFILSFLLMDFFWYYISCFCAVYRNTQIILIKDTLLSFGLSMIYPFGLNLLPGIFRISALRSRKKDKECLYKLSLIVALI